MEIKKRSDFESSSLYLDYLNAYYKELKKVVKDVQKLKRKVLSEWGEEILKKS